MTVPVVLTGRPARDASTCVPGVRFSGQGHCGPNLGEMQALFVEVTTIHQCLIDNLEEKYIFYFKGLFKDILLLHHE